MGDFTGESEVTANGDKTRYRLVQTDGSYTTGSADAFFGATLNDVADGEGVAVSVAGRTKVMADGAINRGDEVMPAADGKVQTASGSGNTLAGRCLRDTVDGEYAIVQLYDVHVTN